MLFRSVWDLLNVWNEQDETYYEYSAQREVKESYDKMGILIQGDSFGKGLWKDILELYPFENVYRIDYDEYWEDRNGSMHKIDSWDTFDISKILNQTDVVVLEVTEPNVKESSWGFVDYLIDFLDNYEPISGGASYVTELNLDSDEAWRSDSLGGMYGREAGFVWAKDYSEAMPLS